MGTISVYGGAAVFARIFDDLLWRVFAVCVWGELSSSDESFYGVEADCCSCEVFGGSYGLGSGHWCGGELVEHCLVGFVEVDCLSAVLALAAGLFWVLGGDVGVAVGAFAFV